jgi:oxygen-independent coproporphyrinogen-3 oxidase
VIVPLALYVHIPFCAYRCRYCNFTFETGWSPALMERTLDTLAAEAETLRQQGDADGFEWRVTSLYIGGGTPSVVPPAQLLPFLKRLEQSLGYRTADLAEATLEANPENVSAGTLAAWSEAGLNRLSIGVQTFDSDRLALLGRWCDGPTNRAALELIAERWRGRWSADLMTGLPGREAPPQRWVDLRRDLTELLSYRPGHISLYSLTVEPGTELATLAQGHSLSVPRDIVADQLWLRARQTLIDQGFEWYEISNFAKTGHRSLHNQVYWRMDWWAGLGPGAEGTLPYRDNDGAIRPRRTRNPKLFPWLNGDRDIQPLTAPEFLLEHYLSGWRTADGIVPGRLSERFTELPSYPLRLENSERLMMNRRLEELPTFSNVQFR